jgi:hypothetical protein
VQYLKDHDLEIGCMGAMETTVFHFLDLQCCAVLNLSCLMWYWYEEFMYLFSAHYVHEGFQAKLIIWKQKKFAVLLPTFANM